MKTVRIRIPVAVSSTGDWTVAAAAANFTDPDLARKLLLFWRHKGDTDHVVWVVADVPLPPVEVVGHVEGGPPVGERETP